MEELLLENLKATSPIFERIVAQCTPTNPHSEAILSKPHPNETLDARLIEALAPKEHDMKLTPFDNRLAAQYQEAYLVIRDDMDGVTMDQLSGLRFIMQPIKQFKAPSKDPSLFELFIAYKTCLFRAVLNPGEANDWLHRMMLALQSLCQKRIELDKAVTLRKEVLQLLSLRSEIKSKLRMHATFNVKEVGNVET